MEIVANSFNTKSFVTQKTGKMNNKVKEVMRLITIGGHTIALFISVFFFGWSTHAWYAENQAQEAWQQEKAETEARLKKQEEIANEAQKDRERALADARAANAVAVRLQQRVEELARSACPATAASSKAARNAGVLLADMFSRADERAGELAEYADRARIAGLACEQAYDALRAGQ